MVLSNPHTLNTHLPSASQFVDRLIVQLSDCGPPEDSHDGIPGYEPSQSRRSHHQGRIGNAFSSLPLPQLSKVKPLLLTLHCLFPNELLLALDILDRKLIRRLIVEGEETFFVISTSSPPPAQSQCQFTSSREHTTKSYEVRLRAWNCTCPNFTLSTFQDPEPSIPEPGPGKDSLESSQNHNDDDPSQHQGYLFGGSLTMSRSSPLCVCKHLLACLLAARCPALFGRGVDDRPVSTRELIAWCAGWAE